MAESVIKSYFPSQVVSDAEKLSYDYGLKVAKAIETEIEILKEELSQATGDEAKKLHECGKELKDKIKERSSHLKTKRSELGDILKETDKEEKTLLEKSKKFEKKIEDNLIAAYKKIRSNVKNGLAIVPIERNASGGSYFTIPPQVQMEIASRQKIIEKFIPYVKKEIKKGTRLNQMMRHTIGLFHGQKGSSYWKRYLSENMCVRDADVKKIDHIMDKIKYNNVDTRVGQSA